MAFGDFFLDFETELRFLAKSTILKTYDGRFKDVFEKHAKRNLKARWMLQD